MTSSTVPTEHSAGGVVFRCESGDLKVLLILDGHGNWGFPKGHLESGEDALGAARREIAEETGLTDLTLLGELPRTQWFFLKKKKEKRRKICDLFVFEAESGEPVPREAEGISRAEWVDTDRALLYLSYDNTKEALRAGIAVYLTGAGEGDGGVARFGKAG